MTEDGALRYAGSEGFNDEGRIADPETISGVGADGQMLWPRQPA